MKQSVCNMEVSVWKSLREGLLCLTQHDAQKVMLGRSHFILGSLNCLHVYMYTLVHVHIWLPNNGPCWLWWYAFLCYIFLIPTCTYNHYFLADLVEPRFVNTHGENKWAWYATKLTKKVWLGIYHAQIQPSDHIICCHAIPGQWLDITWYQDSRHFFWLANSKFGSGN